MRSAPLYLPALWGPEATVEDNPHHTTNVFVPTRPWVTGDGKTITTRMVELFMNSGSPEETVVERFRPGTFYVTAVAQAPRPINARNEIDPVDIDLPGQVTLHLVGADVGFQRIVPRAGYPTIPLADRAPTAGYVPELVIDRKRLKEMRIAGAGIDHAVCFFLKVDGRYGKGQIMWSNLLDPKNPQQLGTSFNVSFWMQSEVGNTDLTWHEAFRR